MNDILSKKGHKSLSKHIRNDHTINENGNKTYTYAWKINHSL
jgi:hypothetical protein